MYDIFLPVFFYYAVPFCMHFWPTPKENQNDVAEVILFSIVKLSL